MYGDVMCAMCVGVRCFAVVLIAVHTQAYTCVCANVHGCVCACCGGWVVCANVV